MRKIKEYTDDDLKRLAAEMSKKVYMRADTSATVEPCADEKAKLEPIIYCALLAVRWHDKNIDALQAILDYAEYMFNVTFTDYEGYRSVYLPLDFLLNRNEIDIRVDENKMRRYINED